MPINIFADASIDLQTKLACAGFLVLDSQLNEIYRGHLLQANATNNTAEILALLMAIDYGASNYMNPDFKNFRVFSDSRISVIGLRDWMFNWVRNMNKSGGNILINSSGKPVANQNYFAMVFQTVMANRISFRLFHNDGHINSEMDRIKARKSFKTQNGVDIERLGLTIDDIARANNSIDASTRDAIYHRKPNDPIVDTRCIFPMTFSPDNVSLTEYFSLLGLG